MNQEQRRELIEAALAVREHAHTPYSGFRVGAAVLTRSGRVFSGCNVENASYGLTICAERVALVCAVAAGEREFAGLAVATTGGASPCGACRQFAAEFRRDLPILIINADQPDHIQETSLALLLPNQFQLRDSG